MSETFKDRLDRIVSDVELGENFSVRIGQDEIEFEGRTIPGRYFFQIAYWRKDIITQEMGFGYGGKAYLTPFASDSELVQVIFGLYKGFWEHEARETFLWRGRRVFGPHISTPALWDVAKRVDVRKRVKS